MNLLILEWFDHVIPPCFLRNILNYNKIADSYIMVEPISLAVISGASIASAILGRFSKKENDSFVTNSHNFKENPDIHFVNIKEDVDPLQLIRIALENPVFIKIKNLFASPAGLEKFLYNLDVAAKNHSLLLNQISSDMLLLRDHRYKTKVQSIIAVNRGSTTSPVVDVTAG